MRVPQVNERVKEAPAQALRAMFAGIGQLLQASDKLRNKAAATKAPAEAASAAPKTMTPETAAPETVASEKAVPETVTPETVAPETVAAETAAPEASVAGGHVKVLSPEETPAAPAPAPVVPAAPAATSGAPAAPELPLANYDDLSIASLRARLRNLTADQLAELVAYEKSHAARADVISMFERRIAKLAEG